ncbi:MAG: ABC transporter permease [Lachnospiraceae bacterium]|nr:ABC transporter permease [Lachnospiraceae bacterium]
MKFLKKAINKIAPVSIILLVLIVWQIKSSDGTIPGFMLPSPIDVVKAFIGDFFLLMDHARYSLTEAFAGLTIGVALGFVIAMVMDRFEIAGKAIYPVLIITQTIPTVALAPLLVLWFGYEMTPKIILIIITSFFPITIGLLDGFKSADKDALNLMKAMGAGPVKRFFHVKVPSAAGHFFSGLRISVSYSIIGAVVAEWLGGFNGLGVYMTRVRKAYAFDKMFAVIFFISALSLLLMYAVTLLQKICMPWLKYKKEEKSE